MKSNKTVLWGCLIFVIALLAAFILGFIFTFGSHGAKSAKIPSNAWLYVNPSALIPDYNELEELRFVNVSSPSVQEICAKIKLAAKDERIKGILLQPQMIMTNYPALEEMSLAIGTFQKSGKPVLAFGENFTQGDYLLASCADKIYMEPSDRSFQSTSFGQNDVQELAFFFGVDFLRGNERLRVGSDVT